MSIQDTLETLLSELKHITKSETVFGEPIIAGNTTIIPVSKISIGFAVGGSGKKEGAGGTGGGAQVIPVAFIAVTNDEVKVLPVEKGNSDYSRLLALAPDVLEKFLKSGKEKKAK